MLLSIINLQSNGFSSRRCSCDNLWFIFWNTCIFFTVFREVFGQQIQHDFEIKSLTGEPDYKSVNLTWEVEDIENDVEKSQDDHVAKSFTIFYCELQNWGPHRCKYKTLDDSKDHRQTKQYSMVVKNLRMATKYSFHVKPQNKKGEQKISGRADLGDNEIGAAGTVQGQSIIIPTKGFSAHATLCLPHASEIEVETGPYFGGRIAAENGNCGVQGDPADPKEIYTMRIEHDKCGSHVSRTDLTVETFITVQENLGILTHSTRRFVVVCTFQPDTLTVRARLALPGKGGATAVATSDWWPTNGRNARERQFKMVDKSSLILKGNDPDNEEVPANVEEMPSVGLSEQVLSQTSDDIEQNNKKIEYLQDAKYARLFDETTKVSEVEAETVAKNFDLSGIIISVCLAMIMIGAFVYLLQREAKKQRQEHIEKIVTI